MNNTEDASEPLPSRDREGDKEPSPVLLLDHRLFNTLGNYPDNSPLFGIGDRTIFYLGNNPDGSPLVTIGDRTNLLKTNHATIYQVGLIESAFVEQYYAQYDCGISMVYLCIVLPRRLDIMCDSSIIQVHANSGAITWQSLLMLVLENSDTVTFHDTAADVSSASESNDTLSSSHSERSHRPCSALITKSLFVR